jgi:SWI/SNF-related matrix-associated actin-dependent regulator of chromatin subfamily A3
MLIERHLKPKTLTWTRFHGPQKKHRILIFSPYDIVITTYETLVSQQKRQRDSKYGDTLFSFAWHRIVLDEGICGNCLIKGIANQVLAHTIRNRGTSMAQACRAVRATSRWAMTGTPIQNRVTDFASLLEYLHIYPFSNPKTFEAEIMKPCMRLDDPDVSRMRKLVNCISLCRTKAVIDLPKREDEIRYLDLSPKEREYYDQVKHNTIKKMDEALAHNPLAPNQYLNALQWLNELRLICNHGLVHSRKVIDKAAVAMSQDQPWNHKIASKAFETLVKAGQAVCKLCGENITEGTGEAANSEFPKPSLSKCLTLICGSCIQIKVGGQKVLTCSCTPKCPKVDVSWAPEAADVRPEKSLPAMKPEEASTKLKALLECLQQSPEDEKR